MEIQSRAAQMFIRVLLRLDRMQAVADGPCARTTPSSVIPHHYDIMKAFWMCEIAWNIRKNQLR